MTERQDPAVPGPEQPVVSRQRRWAWECAALFAAGLGIAVRLLPWRQVFTTSGVVPRSVDDCYHLWRAGRIAAGFTGLFDPYISFPQGAPIPWPYGFDTLLALPGLLGLPADAIASWAAVLMPLLGGLAVYLTYRLGRVVFDPATGLVAAVLLALMPADVSANMLGHIDHHALVAPVMLAIFLALLAALRARGARAQVGWGVALGLLAGLAVASWIISPPLYFLPVPLTIALSRGLVEPRVLRRVAVSALGSSLLFVSLAVSLNADLASRPFSLEQPSYLVLLIYAGLALLGGSWLFGWRVAAGSAGLFAAGIAVSGVWPRLLASLRRATATAAGGDPTANMVQETLALFLDDTGTRFAIDFAVQAYSYLILVVPLVLAFCVWRGLKPGGRTPGRVLFLVYASLGFALLLVMSRFGEFATPAMALLFALSLVGGIRALARWKPAVWGGRAAPLIWGGVALAAAGAFSPMLVAIVRLPGLDLFRYNQDLLAFGRALGEQYPPPAEKGGEPPPYGVLAAWGDSHPLLFSWGLPVMVSSFGADAVPQNVAAFRILLAQDEEMAHRALRENRIRFVVLSPILTSAQGMAAVGGLAERFVDIRRGAQGTTFVPLPPFFRSLHSRLYLGDGAGTAIAGQRLTGVRHLRHIAETRQFYQLLGAKRPSFVAFEVVEGARLAGVAPPGSEVRLSLPVLTNGGRQFLYRDETTAGAEGTFLFVVPYATPATGVRTSARGPYQVLTREQAYRAQVSEIEVQEGKTIWLR